MLRRNSGTCQSPAMALARRLLPQPLTPMMSTPLGTGMPALTASWLKRPFLLRAQSLTFSWPPTALVSSRSGTNSR
jgi:hypothetical protein